MKSEQQAVRVWINGSVYSPADPFATAIFLDGATVAWVGSDDAARAMAGADVTPGDLRAAVVTPAFVAHHRVDGSRELPRAEHRDDHVPIGRAVAAEGGRERVPVAHPRDALPGIEVQRMARR